MHVITKVATITLMIVIMKDWLREYRSTVQRILLTRQKLFPTNKQKTEIGKAVCLFCDNEDYKDNLTAAGEYHSGSNYTVTTTTILSMWNHQEKNGRKRQCNSVN